MDKTDTVHGSAKEQWDNLHEVIEKHGIHGIIVLAFVETILYLVCLLVLNIFGL